MVTSITGGKAYSCRLRPILSDEGAIRQLELRGWGEQLPITIKIEADGDLARWSDQAQHEICSLDEQINQQKMPKVRAPARVVAPPVILPPPVFRKSRLRRVRKPIKRAFRYCRRSVLRFIHSPTATKIAKASARWSVLTLRRTTAFLAGRSISDTEVAPYGEGLANSATAAWLRGHCKAQSPTLVVIDAPLGPAIVQCLESAGIQATLLSPGCGHGPPCQECCVRLARPSNDSFLGWLAKNGAFALRQYGAFVIDIAAGTAATLDALRHRLEPEQALILHVGKGAHDAFSTIGAPPIQSPRGAFHAYRPPPPPLTDFLASPLVLRTSAWPKISIVTVSYNQAQFLEECLDSVLTQNYPNCEYIVVDGGSTDGSINILERYRRHVDRMIIERDEGQSDGLNKGFSHTTGQILNWLNSDDALEPRALFRLADGFLAHAVDLVVGGCRRVRVTRDNLLFTQHSAIPFGAPVRLKLSDILRFSQSWQRADFFFQPEVFFTRGIWERSGAFLRKDLYYAMDYEMWLRMAMAGATVLHIHDVVACSREHAAQKTTSQKPYLPQVRQIFQAYGNLFSEAQACLRIS